MGTWDRNMAAVTGSADGAGPGGVLERERTGHVKLMRGG
jgi:hypothetical protein